MRPFQNLEQPALLDMLAYVTKRYTRKFSSEVTEEDFTEEDYIVCQEILRLLHAELNARKIDSKLSNQAGFGAASFPNTTNLKFLK